MKKVKLQKWELKNANSDKNDRFYLLIVSKSFEIFGNQKNWKSKLKKAKIQIDNLIFGL